MKITWLGHSSFLIEDSKGRRILTDPFDESLGYKTFSGDVDITTISHHHFDHDYIKNLNSSKTHILDKVGIFNLYDIPIMGFPSFHDEVRGTKRGENTIYVITVDGYTICHLGDLGHILSKDEVSSLGNIDILLIPVGGNYTIDAKEAYELTKILKSHIIIPMHYKTPALSFPLDGVENFLTFMKNVKKSNDNFINITGDISDMTNEVFILNYK
ncbi:MBL fold metallo-hydrolase [Clostridium peptidivorans]|uniref:MBL fold metallo-hydrolase n=1 Tax=Clostridium peptidivorans TaxID=100174 RepID=UPI000BE3BFB5|nr:MBL fold metallo-hydrolase [Clostridium peptidivorans]